MKITTGKPYEDRLNVYCNLKFDDEECFCGQPYISLTAWKDGNKWYKPNTIIIGIHDQDDYDIGFEYQPKEHFFNVLHELINWMNDLEHGIIIYDDYIVNIEEFFLMLNCERKLH